jgi:hypothetical protein
MTDPHRSCSVAGAFRVAGNWLLMLLVEALRTYPSIAECPSSLQRLGLDLIIEGEQFNDAGAGAKADTADDQAG